MLRFKGKLSGLDCCFTKLKADIVACIRTVRMNMPNLQDVQIAKLAVPACCNMQVALNGNVLDADGCCCVRYGICCTVQVPHSTTT